MNLKVYWYTPWNLNFILYLSVLSCEHSLRDTKELIHELNKTNDLFKFVRIMRKKFQEVVAQGTTMLLSFLYMTAFMWCKSSVCCRLNLALQLKNKLISRLPSLIIFKKKLKPISLCQFCWFICGHCCRLGNLCLEKESCSDHMVIRKDLLHISIPVIISLTIFQQFVLFLEHWWRGCFLWMLCFKITS